MTFDEYKLQREKNEPRSWSATITMGVLAGFTAWLGWITIQGMIRSGPEPVSITCIIIIGFVLAYSFIALLDGKWKSAKEALYDIFLFLPIP